MKRAVLCLVVLLLLYIGINQFTSYGKEENFGDRTVTFNERTEVGRKLVFKNNSANFDNYYVIRFANNNYIVHSFYYLNNHDQYIEQYKQVYDRVVDYNYSDFMIRTVDGTGSLTYNEFYNMYQELFTNGVYTIMY